MDLIKEVKKLAEHKCISPRDGYVLGIDYYIEQHQFNELLKLISSYEANRAETLVVTMLTEIGEYLKNNSTDEKQAFIKLYDDFAGSIYLQDRNICSDREDEFYTGFNNLNELKEMLDASKHSV